MSGLMYWQITNFDLGQRYASHKIAPKIQSRHILDFISFEHQVQLHSAHAREALCIRD